MFDWRERDALIFPLSRDFECMGGVSRALRSLRLHARAIVELIVDT